MEDVRKEGSVQRECLIPRRDILES